MNNKFTNNLNNYNHVSVEQNIDTTPAKNNSSNNDLWNSLSRLMLIISLFFLLSVLLVSIPSSFFDPILEPILTVLSIFSWAAILHFFLFPLFLGLSIILELIHMIVCMIWKKKINFYNILRLIAAIGAYLYFVKLFKTIL